MDRWNVARPCAFLALVALSAAGCVEPIDEEESRVGELLRDCVVPLPDGVVGWGAPVALEYPDGSLWIFDQLVLEGATVRNAFAFIRSADEVCAGQLSFAGAISQPDSALLLTAEESADNETRNDGRRFELTPIGGLVADGEGILYYEERLNGPGIFDSELLGRGVCIFEDGPDAPCTRLGREGTTRLWDAHDRPFNRGGFVDEDGQALVYGCQHEAAFEDHCVAARAPLDAVADPEAYRFFSPFSGWIEDQANAGVLIEAPGQLTVSWNAFLSEYSAIAMDIWESRVLLYRASTPTGGFDGPIELFHVVPAASLFVSGGVEHASLRSEEGRVIHVSYHTNAEGPQGGLHLASFRFLGGLE